MNLVELHRRTLVEFMNMAADVTGEQWGYRTPCVDWSVRDLVNHVAGEDRWTVPLLQGRTIEDVGTELDGDLLGEHPRRAVEEAVAAAAEIVAEVVPAGGKVHLSYGEEDVAEYVNQLAADHLVHTWDLAVAIGAVTDLDPELVGAVAGWFAEREDLYRAAGMIAPRAPVPVRVRSGAEDRQDRLLAAWGRDPLWGPNHDLLSRFADAWGRCHLDDIMELVAEDCLFESTGPAPDGERHEGAVAIRQVWAAMFANTKAPAFHTEDCFVDGDRGVLRWRFTWVDDGGRPGHVRGVDVLRFRDGKVTEKLSYVKG